MAEIEYLADMFCENGYDRKTLQKTINNLEKKTRIVDSNNNSNTDKKQTLDLDAKNWTKNQKINK